MPQVSVTVAVPDEHIGAVLGKGGRTISEIQVVSGVRIKVSDRNDFVEGTRNRKVSLTGTAEGRGLHSSTCRLNLSAFGGIGGAHRGCVAHVG